MPSSIFYSSHTTDETLNLVIPTHTSSPYINSCTCRPSHFILTLDDHHSMASLFLQPDFMCASFIPSFLFVKTSVIFQFRRCDRLHCRLIATLLYYSRQSWLQYFCIAIMPFVFRPVLLDSWSSVTTSHNFVIVVLIATTSGRYVTFITYL